MVLLTQPRDTLESLAAEYLGDRDQAWIIADFNRLTRLEAGKSLVIPLRPRNPGGIRPGGYQTVPVLCYHRIGSGRGKMIVSPGDFAEQMAYLAREGYRVISLPMLRDFLAGRGPLPAKSVVITFDDGYRSTYEFAFPILKKHGFPATVFLYSDFIGAGDALSWSQLREMVGSGLIEIQPHSKSHTNLVLRLPQESDGAYQQRLRTEMEKPGELIRQRLGREVYAYAYPYGDANQAVTVQMEHNRMALGFTVTPGGNGFFAYPYLLRRTMVFGDDKLSEFKTKLAVFAGINGQ